ncbi:hypothetical protein [Paracoccus hibiscisoli]|uniref:hypothetical protein n=1 Tax=Paracoccus hibiscisoli TaxID=2023261 RepID=UPI0023F3F241|nr:hypothetical protein [Paracoccus hibiscisoli]
MIRYAILDAQGIVVGLGDALTADEMIGSTPEGCTTTGLGDDEYPVPMAEYLGADDLFHPLPPRPGPWARWQSGEWIDPRTPADIEAELVAARLRSVAAINAASGPIRRLYVTDIPGQEALYLMKEAEARAWVASANPDATHFPLIAAEVGITAPTAGEVAQVYLNLAGIYTAAAAQLETVRLGHIAQAEAAPTPEAAAAVSDAFRALFA